MIRANEWIKQKLGTYNDVDGFYGAQCWDLFAEFCKDYGYPIFNCTKTGYVADLWNCRKTSGILKYFEVVDKNKLQKGDWIIWTTSPYGTGNSHIAMFVEYKGSSFKVLGQNQTKDQKACYANLAKKGVGGCFRPKCFSINFDYFVHNRVGELQDCLNGDLNAKLAHDNSCGPATQDAMKKVEIKPYPNKNYAKDKRIIKFVQKYVGANMDGSYGPATERKVIQYRRNQGLIEINAIDFVLLYAICRYGKY